MRWEGETYTIVVHPRVATATLSARFLDWGGGVAMADAAILSLMDPSLFADAGSVYDRPDLHRGMIFPEFWGDGDAYVTVGEIASAVVGGAAHELGHTFGLDHFYGDQNGRGMEDSNGRGNMLGHGHRGIRNFLSDWCDISVSNARHLGDHFLMRRLRDRADLLSPWVQEVMVDGSTVTVWISDSGGTGLRSVDFLSPEDGSGPWALRDSLRIDGTSATVTYPYPEPTSPDEMFRIVVCDGEGNQGGFEGAFSP